MSGGDLDGDVYMIIWDKEILSHIDKIPAPADPPKEWEEMYTEDLSAVNRNSIEDSIVCYFKRDILGQTSNLHLNLAINEGLNCDETQVAAFLASI